MADNALQHLADVEEIRIGFHRPDGSTGSTPVWVVRAGDDLFVRSMYGLRGGWYRRLRANPDGEVHDQAHTHPVRAEPVADAGTVVEVTRAYAAKYANPYVQSLLSEEAADATLRLKPGASAAFESDLERRVGARRPVGRVHVACDLPGCPGITTPTGCTPWRQGSWARPSNRSQASLGCDPLVSAPRPDQQAVDRWQLVLAQLGDRLRGG